MTRLLIDTRIVLPLTVVNSAAMVAGVQGICFECLLLVPDGSLFLELGLVCHMVVLETGAESHRGEASVSYSNFMSNFRKPPYYFSKQHFIFYIPTSNP